MTTVRLMGGELPLLAGRYEIRQLLGRGSHGVVCRAHDRRLGREVALKLFPLPTNAQGHAGVEREAKTLAQLRHPNIVDVYDFEATEARIDGYSAPIWLLSMELLRGKNLRAWLQDGPAKEEILRVLADAAEGLAAAHREGVVHRDFKPENVIVSEDGEVDVVDFGLARSSSEGWGWEGTDAHQTTAAGTPAYMAPEAARGDVDSRADQFALGVCIVEALTREDGDDRPAIDLLAEGIPKLPRPLRAVVAQATRTSARRRHDSVYPLLLALRPPRRPFVGPVLLAAGVLVAAGIGTVLANRGGSGSPAPVVQADASPPADDCAQVEGLWDFETDVAWAEDTRFESTHGVYELEMTRMKDCDFLASVRMTGERGTPYKWVLNYQARTRVVASSSGASTEVDAMLVSTRPNAAPRRRRFQFEFSGEALGGQWTGLERSGASEIMRGQMRGSRRR